MGFLCFLSALQSFSTFKPGENANVVCVWPPQIFCIRFAPHAAIVLRTAGVWLDLRKCCQLHVQVLSPILGVQTMGGLFPSSLVSLLFHGGQKTQSQRAEADAELGPAPGVHRASRIDLVYFPRMLSIRNGLFIT